MKSFNIPSHFVDDVAPSVSTLCSSISSNLSRTRSRLEDAFIELSPTGEPLRCSPLIEQVIHAIRLRLQSLKNRSEQLRSHLRSSIQSLTRKTRLQIHQIGATPERIRYTLHSLFSRTLVSPRSVFATPLF